MRPFAALAPLPAGPRTKSRPALHERRRAVRAALAGIALIACPAIAQAIGPSSEPSGSAVPVIAGMPPVIDPANLYSETAPGRLSPKVGGQLSRIYVPHVQSIDVYVNDPEACKVVDRYKVGKNPQHVVPSWDLQTLWVNDNAEHRTAGSLTPIDPRTGKPGHRVAVDDPYNMYFTPDGRWATVVAEALKRLDFRDPHTHVRRRSDDATTRNGHVRALVPDGLRRSNG